MRISDWSSDVCSSDLLVLDRNHAHVVRRARIPVGIEPVFGNEEQRDAARPRGRIGGAREHEVDDVVGHVVIAERDEDLDAMDRPSTEEHTSELQSLMRISYAVFCLKKQQNSSKL